MSVSNSDILVRVDTTPNPFAVKLVANIPFIQTGKATFTSEKDCDHIPLFKDLFSISGISQIHAFENQITLSYKEGITFEEIENNLLIL